LGKKSRYFDGIIPTLPGSIKKVGVLLMKHSLLLSKVLKHDLQVVQLHGKESVDFCQELRSQLPKGIEIIKVFSIQDEFDFSALKPFEEFCDSDTKGKLPGNGTTFDWTVLKNILRQSRFLSGGIGLEELKAVQEITKQIYLFTL
jgi:phosphoribosylanthranilate isomerase